MPEFGAWDVTRIARDVAAARELPIKIIGAIAARGSDYVEILINIVTGERAPCVVSVGLFRNVSEAHLTLEIAQRLQRQLDDRQAR